MIRLRAVRSRTCRHTPDLVNVAIGSVEVCLVLAEIDESHPDHEVRREPPSGRPQGADISVCYPKAKLSSITREAINQQDVIKTLSARVPARHQCRQSDNHMYLGRSTSPKRANSLQLPYIRILKLQHCYRECFGQMRLSTKHFRGDIQVNLHCKLGNLG
jgi:hypothetical protein